ncbi:nascent polypeptide-associated complex protein [Candidatus Pacearchaeota archaeon]|nr:nascent polypeptide-associated complex protein [Candidatus Pacearchaeota archaeon]
MMNLNPKKMQALMKQMGMSQDEIEASKVTIEKPDGNIVINNPSVMKIIVQGKESFQITGDVQEESEAPSISEDDVKTVMEKTDCTEDQAKKVLESVKGDLAEAILELS